jgi:hypothetical protein
MNATISADPLLDLVADLRTAGWCRSCQQAALEAWVRMVVVGIVLPSDRITVDGYVRSWSATSLGCFAHGCPRRVTLR